MFRNNNDLSMYDNGFARAQAAYEAMEPPDNTEEWEAYERKYSTDNYEVKLVEALAKILLEDGHLDDGLDPIIRRILKVGIGHHDIDGIDKLYAFFKIAPSFDTFTEDRRDDDPYDREPDEDALQDRMGR